MINRHITEILKHRYQYSRSVYVLGPRQSGKTTLAKQVFTKLRYVNLEDPDTLEFSVSDPRGFFSQFDKDQGGIIDEPQRNTKLFSYLQGQIDHENKKFILISSQNFLTMESIAQSLAGRITILNLLPLSKQEIMRRPLRSMDSFLQAQDSNKNFDNIDLIWDFILKGGYPEVITVPQVFPQWFSDYVKTYLERDVRRIINVQDLGLFQKFLKLCAGRTGNILNKASLAADCGISETTCVKWLSLLEQSGIITLLKPYYNSFNKRQTKSPKLYFVDTGLCCYLLGIKLVEHLLTHPLQGAILETYVISELHKQFFNHGENIEFYYWRDQHGQEIDLIIDLPNGKTLPIEIKTGQTISHSMTSSLIKWCELAKIDRAVLLYGGNAYQARTGLDIIPISQIV